MELYIGGKNISKYNDVEVTLRYDSIADTFSFKTYFDPANKDGRSIFRPLAYHSCKVKYKGQTLITGTTLINTFREKGSLNDLATISGYSRAGILGDCTIHPDTETPQLTQKPTLKQIVETYIKPFGIGVTIDKSVEKECTTEFNGNYLPREDMMYRPVAEILAQLCSQQLVILSHDVSGNLLLTKPKADKIVNTKQTDTTIITNEVAPSAFAERTSYNTIIDYSTTTYNRKTIYKFHSGNKVAVWTEMQLIVNGQGMHYQVIVETERADDQKNTNVVPVTNPLISMAQKRVQKVQQRDGNGNTTSLTARAIMGHEMQGIVLTIEIVGWELNGKLVTPNNLIIVNNPNIYLYRDTRFFVTQVEFKGPVDKKTATLTCVLPESFNDEPIKDIFG